METLKQDVDLEKMVSKVLDMKERCGAQKKIKFA